MQAKRHKRQIRGIGKDAELETSLSCVHRDTIRSIAREVVRTKCTDRVIVCKNGRIVVTAVCPTDGAARLYESQINGFVDALKMLGR